MSRRTTTVVVVATVVLVLAAVALLVRSNVEDGRSILPFDESRRPQGEITVAYPDEPLTLNPFFHAGNSNATRDLLRPVLPTLLSISPELSYRPDLATKVPAGRDIGSNPFSVTFKLNEKARWSDGASITAEDVRFTWEVIKDTKWPIADRTGYDRLTDLEVVDRNTVKLVFDRPYPAWRDLFSASGFVLPKHLLEGKDFSAEMATDLPFSGGPFMIQSFTPGLQIVYLPNPKWWGPSPLLERVTVQFVPDVETSLQLLERERVNVVVQTTQVNLTNRAKMRGAEVRSAYGSAWWELAFNHSRPAVSDAGWRRGVATGFDRAGIVEAIIREEGRPLDHLAPGSKFPNAFSYAMHDPAKTKESLRAAGFRESSGFFGKPGIDRIQISSPSESEIATVVERGIQVGLRNTGIQLEIANPRSQLLYGEWRIQGTYDLAVWERRSTPSIALSSHFRSNRQPEGLNYYRVASSDIDRTVDIAEGLSHPEANSSTDAMNAIAAAIPAIPLFEAKMFIVFKGLSGPDPNATVEGPFWNLENWALRG